MFGKPRIGEEEIQEVAAALRSGWIGTGPRVQKFEQEFLSARTLGVPLTPCLDNQDVEDVVTAVTKVLLHYSH